MPRRMPLIPHRRAFGTVTFDGERATQEHRTSASSCGLEHACRAGAREALPASAFVPLANMSMRPLRSPRGVERWKHNHRPECPERWKRPQQPLRPKLPAERQRVQDRVQHQILWGAEEKDNRVCVCVLRVLCECYVCCLCCVWWVLCACACVLSMCGACVCVLCATGDEGVVLRVCIVCVCVPVLAR